jgi:hypothetical protein
MPKQHGAREQKRLAKQKAKREIKRRQLARSNSPDPTVRLKAADRWPIVASLVPENLWDLGLGNLLIARRTPDGQLACANFLVDVFCLGVKDATWLIVGPGQFNEIRGRLNERGRFKEVTPEHFAKLVYCAADFGQSLGFPPHRDFRHAQKLLAGIDPSQCPDDFEFGQEGRPVYIRGPFESMDDARIIAARVRAIGGDYVVPLRPSEAGFELMAGVEDMDHDAADEDGPV